MKDGTTTSGRAAYDEAMAQLREADPEPVSEAAYSENYAAWLAAGRPMHEFRPRAKYASLCGTCSGYADSGTHPVGMTPAQALAALDSRPRTGPGTGLSAMVQPAELVPLRNLVRAVRWEQEQQAEAADTVADALAKVNRMQALRPDYLPMGNNTSAVVDELIALRKLADAVRARQAGVTA